MSRELILKMSMSIDGFVAGPNGEMDWIFSTSSQSSREWVLETLWEAGLHAMGHRSYQDMAPYWPTSTLPMARAMNEIPKVVFSRIGVISPPNLGEKSTELKYVTRAEPEAPPVDNAAVLDGWMNPLVAGLDLVTDIKRLKEEGGKPILAHGGASFASSLIAANLVDEYRLIVHPIILGRGLPIFAELPTPLNLKLQEVKQFDSGVVAKIYRPA